MNRKPIPTRLALAAAVAVLQLSAAQAQTATTAATPATEAKSDDGLKLNAVVITGTSTGST